MEVQGEVERKWSMMRQLEECHAKIRGKWRLVRYVCTYTEPHAFRVVFDKDEWVVRPFEFHIKGEHAEMLRQEFERANASWLGLMRACKKPVKAQIARVAGISIGKLRYSIGKAVQLGVSLSSPPET